MKVPTLYQVSRLRVATEDTWGVGVVSLKDTGRLRRNAFPAVELLPGADPGWALLHSGAPSRRKPLGCIASSQNPLAPGTTHVCTHILASRKPVMWASSQFPNKDLGHGTPNAMCPLGLIKCSLVTKMSLLKSRNLAVMHSMGFWRTILFGELLGCLLKPGALKMSWVLLDTIICKPDLILPESSALRGTGC